MRMILQAQSTIVCGLDVEFRTHIRAFLNINFFRISDARVVVIITECIGP
jgi:hypothetical protein